MHINSNHTNRFMILFALCLLVFQSASAQNTAAPKSTSEKRVIEQLFAVWNSHDDVTARHISRGRDEVRKWVEGGLAAIENFKIEVASSTFDNGRGVAEWVWSGTDKGLLKTSKKFSVRGVSVYEVCRGTISCYKEFYDFATVMR